MASFFLSNPMSHHHTKPKILNVSRYTYVTFTAAVSFRDLQINEAD